MNMVFKAQKMIDRITKEGRANLLDETTLKFIKSLDNKIGNTYNWRAQVYGEDVVYIEKDSDQDGTYVALCDCDYL